MNKWLVYAVTMTILAMVMAGCSGSGQGMVTPEVQENPVTANSAVSQESNTHLWGWYDMIFNRESGTIDVVPDRAMMFTANVVNFLNSKPAGLTFHINGINVGTGYTDVDIDVSITHPFPGMPQYNGYDVRGVFMGNGSGTLMKGGLRYPVAGEDQYMTGNPDDGIGSPDGYTRWFNFAEFSMGGMPLFQYTQGNLASPGFAGTSELNPYKYFADGLNETDKSFEWLLNHGDQDGQFSSGATNTRNYNLRFPDVTGVVYGYAITANWEGTEPDLHPSNAPEAIACAVLSSNSTVYWTSTQTGGEMVLDISLWDWDSAVSNGVMEDYKIFVESTVLQNVYELTTEEMTPVLGGEFYSTYHVEIPADNVQGLEGNEYWVIVEQNGYDYTNDFGTENLAGEEPLTAYFRYDLEVGGEAPGSIELTAPNGGEEFIPGEETEITWTYTGLTGTVLLEYSRDNFTSNINTIATDIPVSEESYTWTIPCDPSDNHMVRITSIDVPTAMDTSDDVFSVENSGWAEKWGDAYYDEGRRIGFDPDGNVYLGGTHRPAPGDRNYGFVAKFNPCGELLWDQWWGGAGHTQGYDVAVDSDGNSYVTGNFYGTTNFDPDDIGGPNQITSTGGGSWDAWLVKFDTTGDFVWVRTWGGTYSDSGLGVAVDDVDGVYVTGEFSLTVDYDPSSGVDSHSSVGDFDCYLTKFDYDGNHEWAKTWGSVTEDRPRDVAFGGSNAYVTGFFSGTDVNFNPDGTQNLSSNGGFDSFLTAWDSTGIFQWAYNWGGSADDEGTGVTADADYAYGVGRFRGSNVDFDPTAGTDNHNSKGADDSYLTKFGESGDYVWARNWGGTVNDMAYGVGVDSSGNLYVSGDFWTLIDLDPDGGDPHPVVGFIDSYMSKFDSGGNYQWGRTFGSTDVDRAYGINSDPDGNAYVTGFINGQANLAPGASPCNEPAYNVVPTGGADAFLIKYLPPDGCW